MKQLHREELIRRYIDAYNRFDVDAMIELLHPYIVFQNISNGVVNAKATGKGAFDALARESAKLFKARTQTGKAIEVHGDKAIA